jgi:hypothetical protein
MEVSFSDTASSLMETGPIAKLIGDQSQEILDAQKKAYNRAVPYVNMKIEQFSPRIQ